MLKDLYIPSYVEGEGSSPDVPVGQKLREIAGAEPTVSPILAGRLPVPINENYYQVYLCDPFRKRVPYVKGMRFEISEEDGESSLDIEWLDLGDKELYGHGIGTRLLRKAVEYGLESKENLTALTISPGNLGIIKTISKVVGEEHVAFRKNSTWYGEGHDKPLEQVIDDVPYREGERYRFQEVRASIHPEAVQKLGGQAVRTT